MVYTSNVVIITLNCISVLVGLAIIGGSLYIHARGGTTLCQRTLQYPLLIIGFFLFAISAIGLLGTCCKVDFLMWVYLVLVFLVIVGLMVFTAFALVVTNQRAAKKVSERNFFHGDYRNWLNKNFLKGKHWEEIKSCLIDVEVCRFHDFKHLYRKGLSPIQSGCCKPPRYCGFEYKNATFWDQPKSGPAVLDSDCTTWSNDQDKLCYNCESCKRGVLANIRQQWRLLAICNIVIVLLMIVIISIGCCARSNNRFDLKYSRFRRQPSNLSASV